MRKAKKVTRHIIALVMVSVMCIAILPFVPAKAADYPPIENDKSFSVKCTDSTSYTDGANIVKSVKNGFGGVYNCQEVHRLWINPADNSAEVFFRRYVMVDEEKLAALSDDLKEQANEAIRLLRSTASTKCTGKLNVEENPYTYTLTTGAQKIYGNLRYRITELQWDGPEYMVGFAPNTDEVIPMYMTHCDNYGNDDGNCSISLSLSYGSGVSASNESWVTNGEVSYVSTVCASKDGGRHNAYNMGKKYSLTNIKMPYTMKKDSFSFKNAETNFSFSRNESSDYAPAFGRKNGNAISKKLAESMLSSPTLKTDTARAALKEIIADDFKGFCYGMSITSGKIYAGSLLRSNLGDADAKTTYEMKKPSENVLL